MAVLTLGSRGERVKAWQRALLDQGFEVVDDGRFGPVTEDATREFQRDRHLKADGRVGPITRAAMGRSMYLLPSLYAGLVAVASTLEPAWRGPLGLACSEFAILSRARLAAFLAQLAHESGGFTHWREVWGPTAAQKRYEPPSSLAKTLGNTQKGDGFRFRGRGPIQITGRANHAACGKALGIDLVAHPELLEKPDVGFRAAGWFWSSRRLNTWADKQTADAFEEIGRRINGKKPPNGAADRRARWAKARAALGIA